MNTATATTTARTAKRTATITNNRADLHQFFTVPTGILATSAIARAIVSALTDTTTFDEIFRLTGSTDFAEGFIYRMPQGGDNYTAIEIKRYGPARTSITLIAHHYSPRQQVLDHRIIARELTLSHFITYLQAHAK